MEIYAKAKGQFWKKIEDVFLEVDGKQIKLLELAQEVEHLQEENKQLKSELEAYKIKEARIDDLMSRSLDLLQKKVARLEVMGREDE